MKNKIFNYIVEFITVSGELEITGYNTPYSLGNEQALEDVTFAILEQKVIDISTLNNNEKYTANIECLFLPNYGDNTYDQLFSLKTLVGSSDPVGS